MKPIATPANFSRCTALTALFLCCLQPIGSAAAQPIASPAESKAGSTVLTIIDESGKERAISAAKFARLPRQKVRVLVHGKNAEFEGPLLSDVLQHGGIKLGDDLKGRRAATVAVLEATDGYRAVITLVDIDASTTDNKAILADRRDGQPLALDEAPYRLIVPGDKRPLRWIRMVKSIRILNLHDAATTGAPTEATAAPGK